MNKDEVLDALEDSREQFLDAIEGLPDEALEEEGVVGQWSIKDLMSHVIAWEAELVKLLWQAQQGEKPTTVHFSKKSVDDTNAAWYKETHERPLERVVADFQGVRRQTERRVAGFSSKDLTDPQRFPWLGEEPLWKWISNDSFGHEAEHAEQIRQWRSQRGL